MTSGRWPEQQFASVKRKHDPKEDAVLVMRIERCSLTCHTGWRDSEDGEGKKSAQAALQVVHGGWLIPVLT